MSIADPVDFFDRINDWQAGSNIKIRAVNIGRDSGWAKKCADIREALATNHVFYTEEDDGAGSLQAIVLDPASTAVHILQAGFNRFVVFDLKQTCDDRGDVDKDEFYRYIRDTMVGTFGLHLGQDLLRVEEIFQILGDESSSLFCFVHGELIRQEIEAFIRAFTQDRHRVLFLCTRGRSNSAEKSPSPLVNGIPKPAEPPFPAAPGMLFVSLPPKHNSMYQYELGERTMIGRQGGADIPLSDPFSSSRQCLIERDPAGQYFVEDLGSSNGTFLNNQKIGLRTLLKTGDIISTGKTMLGFEIPPPLAIKEEDQVPGEDPAFGLVESTLLETLVNIFSEDSGENKIAEEIQPPDQNEIERKKSLEIELAAGIQRDCLPKEIPDRPHIELVGRSVPCRQIGGDYYDFIPMDDGLMGMAIADVSGQGVSATLLMASLRAALHAEIRPEHDLAMLAAKLSDFVFRSSSINCFITFFWGELDTGTGVFRYINAGHPPPIIISDAVEPRFLPGTGLAFGLLPDQVYDVGQAVIEPGETIVLYSDGIIESRGASGEEYGIERLAGICRSAIGPASVVINRVFEDMESFTGGHEAADDRTLVVARRLF